MFLVEGWRGGAVGLSRCTHGSRRGAKTSKHLAHLAVSHHRSPQAVVSSPGNKSPPHHGDVLFSMQDRAIGLAWDCHSRLTKAVLRPALHDASRLTGRGWPHQRLGVRRGAALWMSGAFQKCA
jgi:hypothetical protein